MKPTPQPVDVVCLRDLAQETMSRAEFPMLASIDGNQPRLRPISTVAVEGFTVYMASLRSSHKTGELESNSKVELCFLDDRHDQVRITGNAELILEKQLLQQIWEQNPLLRSFLGSINNPEFMLYRIKPSQVRFMREWALNYYDVPLT